MNKTVPLLFSLGLLWQNPAFAYQSHYDLVQWDQRGEDTEYCIDITDTDWKIYTGLQSIQCAEGLHEFSPKAFVEKSNLKLEPGFTFRWRVWSTSGYGGDGFEGEIVVGETCGQAYRSDTERLQWACRFQDSQYCLDLYDETGEHLDKAAICGDNLHHIDLADLDLDAGVYRWKVSSDHAYNYEPKQYDAGIVPSLFSGGFSYGLPKDQRNNSDVSGTHAIKLTDTRMEGDCQLLLKALDCQADTCFDLDKIYQLPIEQTGDQVSIKVDLEGLPVPLNFAVNLDDTGFLAAEETQIIPVFGDFCVARLDNVQQIQFSNNHIDQGVLQSHVVLEGLACGVFSTDCTTYITYQGAD